MKRVLKDYIYDIVDSLKEVGEFTEGMNLTEFIKDKRTINAVIRSLEVMGEASKKVPEGTREKYQHIPWKRIAGMRDKLIHEYHGVDLEIVWTVVKEELPPLKPFFENMLRDIE